MEREGNEWDGALWEGGRTNLGESTVIPDVAVVGEAVAHETQAALLDVLLNRVERLFFANFHLSVGPSRDFDDHVEDAVTLIGEEWDVVERRDDLAIVFDVDAMFYLIGFFLVKMLDYIWKRTYRGCWGHR